MGHLGLIVVAYLIYGAVVVGTSIAVSGPEHAFTRLPDGLLPAMLFGAAASDMHTAPMRRVQLDTARP